jgi:hypothetical protein
MKIYGWLGLLLLIISEYCLFQKIEPFHSWFFCFAWWSYILLADNLLLKLRGRSLLCGRRADLMRMLPLSVFIWLLFEAYNLIVKNWAYSGVPAEPWIRWIGYSVAFATILPGIFITGDILDWFLFGRREGPSTAEYIEQGSSPRGALVLPLLLLGIGLSAAPLFWPRYFFPAVWLGPIFLFDPLLERFGMQGLLLRPGARQRQMIWSLLGGGFACGLMWEFWNFWAGSKWVYSVPFFGGWKVFEMPVLGFLGFPPFALECWILYHLCTQILQRSGRLQPVVWFGIALFCLLLFRAIDHHTVLDFVSQLRGGISVWSYV